jgi:hypothetical protein
MDESYLKDKEALGYFMQELEDELADPGVPGGGNTKTPPSKCNPALKWCFTLNNYSEDDFIKICSICSENCKSAGVGKEVGESGTPHLQGFVEFKKKSRPMTVFKAYSGIHWEKMKGTVQDSILYCSKDGDYWAHGHRVDKPLKLIDDLRPWQKDVVAIVSAEPDDRTIHWFWEKIGGVGKSALCKLLCAKHGALICSGKASDMKYMIVKYKEKHGCFPECIIFDVPRASLGYLSYTGIEEIKNGCFANSKYECDMVIMNSPHVIVFANGEPDLSQMSADRWEVRQLD